MQTHKTKAYKNKPFKPSKKQMAKIVPGDPSDSYYITKDCQNWHYYTKGLNKKQLEELARAELI